MTKTVEYKLTNSPVAITDFTVAKSDLTNVNFILNEILKINANFMYTDFKRKFTQNWLSFYKF